MKRIILLLLGSLFITMQVAAQTEDKKEFIIKDKKQLNYKLLTNPIQNRGFQTEYPTLFPSSHFGTFNQKLNFTNDNRDGKIPFRKNLFINLEKKEDSYLNLASYQSILIGLGLRMNKKLSITGGLLAIKQTQNNSPATDRLGAKFNINYFGTEKLEFNLWGQYLSDGYKSSDLDFLFPQTSTGASATVHLGGRSQLGVGAQYQYDNQKEKWNYKSGGKLLLNF